MEVFKTVNDSGQPYNQAKIWLQIEEVFKTVNSLISGYLYNQDKI